MRILLIVFLLVSPSNLNDDSLSSGRIELLEHGWAGVGDAREHFAIYHDKQSGDEFICVQSSTWNNDSGISCFATGRKW